MFKKIFTLLLVTVLFGLASPAWSYDAALAKGYADLFAPAKGAAVGKKLQLMKAEKFVEAVKAKTPMVVVDVRTPAETNIISATLPGTLAIPIHELFTKAKLDSLPTEKKVVILCKSGTRATAAGTALRYIGFNNVYVLKGGLKALIGYLGPKEANSPMKKVEKK